MKVLQINAKDIKGGAARAAYRIHKGLLGKGIESNMLVQNKYSTEPEIYTPYDSKIKKIYARSRSLIGSLLQKFQSTQNEILHSSNVLPSGLHKLINRSDADVVNLHWINDEMISISEISKIKKPLVWTLHDMWAFCGAEHYDDLEYSNRYIEGYNKKNRPPTYSKLDLDRWTWKRKKKHWNNLKSECHFVTPSNWLAECFNESDLFKGESAKVIPNGLDTDIFKPTEKHTARNILNIPLDKEIVLFGAMSFKGKTIKGYHKLREALDLLIQDNADTPNLYFLVFGSSHQSVEKNNGITTQYLGKIKDDIMLSLIYSAADVMVVPSFLEAFGQTASEALACGTPVAAFNATGLKDIVDHKSNGYLAEPYEVEDLASGIEWILRDKNKLKKLGLNARLKVEEKFDIKSVANLYLNLYKKILS